MLTSRLLFAPLFTGVALASRRWLPPQQVGKLCLCLVLTVGAGACSSAMNMPLAADPEQIPHLEARVTRNPGDVAALAGLGSAYRAAGRPADARHFLERALQLEPSSPAAFLQLGLTYEDLELFPQARETYQRYLTVGTSRQLRTHVRSRLTLVDRLELRASIRQALATEATLRTAPADPRFIAIYPFGYLGSNPDFVPLARALADMLTTDLSQTDRVRVLERAQIQLLLDELDLAASGAVDPATAARGGQLLGATRIVQGQLANQAELLSLQATVANVQDGQVLNPVLAQDSLSRYFDLQKRLVIGLYESLGVQLTPAERERVERRPTMSMQALLEYGLGLLAEDRRDFVTAAQHFRRAAELDPTFQDATTRAVEAQDLADTQEVPTAELGQLASVELLQPLPTLEMVELIIPTILPRDPISEVLGTDGVGRDVLLDIIIRIP